MGRKELRYLSIARTLLAGLLCLSTSAHPAPEWTVKPGTKLVPDPALTEPDEQLVASFGGFGVGTCAACSSIRRRPPQPITIPPPPASPSLPAGKLEGGCDRMANVGKEVVWKVYGNHQYSYPPKCGVGVFASTRRTELKTCQRKIAMASNIRITFYRKRALSQFPPWFPTLEPKKCLGIKSIN